MPSMSGSVSEQVVQEVANTTGKDALELPSLYEVIDPDALDTLVAEMSDGGVSFSYAGHEVTVKSDGSISLEEYPTTTPTADIAVSDD